MRKFTIYSSDDETPWPIIEISVDDKLLASDMEHGIFSVDKVAPLIQKAANAIQEAINKGKENAFKASSNGGRTGKGTAEAAPRKHAS